jgi:hypothetical protein
VDALVNSSVKYESLKTLKLSTNYITSDGLQCLSKLDSGVLPSLTRLDLCYNNNLLDDADGTKLFAQKLLLSQGATLKEELKLRYCSDQAAGYCIIIKSLETNATLKQLDMSESVVHRQAIREQLIQSLPKMTGLQDLAVGRKCIDLDDQRTMTALRQNVSLVSVDYRYFAGDTPLSDHPRLAANLERNKHLMKLDCLLDGTPARTMPMTNNTTTRTMPPPCDGLWAPVLAKVGPSPVFKVLRNRLATWNFSENKNVTRKHSRGY